MGSRFAPRGFARPENALKRSEELENVGQKNAALQVLHDIVTSKRHRTWSKTYESIMFRHIDLVVDMRKRNFGKEALMQYRNMCQSVNINSLEEVIKYYLKKASDRTEAAQKQAAVVTVDVADLEEDASPEDIMLSYVSADKGKDRTDRELVTPWFRFLWEAYRSVLEILRMNPKLEPLYAMTANKAFQFCLQFKRTAEFRRLCDLLRQHLTISMMRYRENRDAQPDQLQVHLETRFEQLKVACELEMWAEAFRSVEDIQQLITLAKKFPKQQLMANYYARLTQIFAVSENHLYHAYAWLKLFNFTKSHNKNVTQADLQAMASSVLLAMLSILPYDQRAQTPQDEQAQEQEKLRILRMADILGFAVDARKDYRQILSRSVLLNSVGAVNVLAIVPPEIRQIFEFLTTDFSPLELGAKLAPLLVNLKDSVYTGSAACPVKAVDLSMYIPQLKQISVLRLLKQLSEVYSSLKISSLEALVPFMPFSDLEAVLVDAVKCDYLQIRVDHRNGTLQFGCQQLESEAIRTQLQTLATRLTKAVTMITPAVVDDNVSKRRKDSMQLALTTLQEANIKANARKTLIEKRKEEAELALLEAEKEEERRRAHAAREAELADEKRRRDDALRREKDRLERELEERELEEARAMLEAASKKRAGAGKLVATDKPLDKRAIMQEALTERMKEAQDMERRMTRLARNLDHLERARREEEAPLIAELGEKKLAEDLAAFQELQRLDSERHKAQWEADLAEKHRLSVMLPDKEIFAKQVIARRQEEFEALQRQKQQRLAERRRQARAERAVARIREYVRRCQAEVSRRVAQMEEEEAEREQERKKQEEEERRRKLEEVLAQQRKREQELEAKLRAEKEAASNAPPPAATTTASNKYVPPAHMRRAAGGGGDVPRPSTTTLPDADYRDRRTRRDDSPPPSRQDDDRWGRSSIRRDEDRPRYAPPAPRAGDSDRFSGPSASAAGAPPSQTTAPAAPAVSSTPAASSSASGKYIPKFLKR